MVATRDANAGTALTEATAAPAVEPIRVELAGGSTSVHEGDSAIGVAGEPLGKRREGLQLAMSQHAGVLRDAGSLARADAWARSVLQPPSGGREPMSVEEPELHNLGLVARAVVAAALAREESRGCHNRRDFPAVSADGESHLVVVAG